MKRFRSPAPDEKKHRFAITLAREVDATVADMAKNERRSLASMCEILVEEAVKFRKEKEADDGA